MTAVVGYPLHAVSTFSRRTNPHGVPLTDWKAACGQEGTSVGTTPFGESRNGRRTELCVNCFPRGHFTLLPAPTEVPSCVRGN